MLNPLLHTSNSAPTSPVCTRSIHAKKQADKRLVTKINKIRRDHSPTAVLGRPKPSTTKVLPKERRLSRLVKCRALEFREFPEGMRQYSLMDQVNSDSNNNYQTNNNNKVVTFKTNKPAVRNSKSQPGSPVSIPRIKVEDFGLRRGSFHMYQVRRIMNMGIKYVRKFNLVVQIVSCD